MVFHFQRLMITGF